MKPSDFPPPGSPRWLEWRATGLSFEDWFRANPPKVPVVDATSPPVRRDLPGQRTMPFAIPAQPEPAPQVQEPLYDVTIDLIFEEKVAPRPGAIWPEDPDSDVWPAGRE